MAKEHLSIDRRQVFYYNALALDAGQDIPTALGGAAGSDIIVKATGQARVVGMVAGSAAPAAGYPRIRFFATPSGSAIATKALTVDPDNSNVYFFDVPLYSPFFTIEWTQGAAAGTLSGCAWVLPEPNYPSISSGGSGPTPSAAVATKTAISFAAAGDNTVIAAVAATKIRIFHYTFIAAGATSVTFKSGANAYSGAIPLVNTQGLAFDAPGGIYPIILGTNEAWVINNLNAVAITGFALYTQS